MRGNKINFETNRRNVMLKNIFTRQVWFLSILSIILFCFSSSFAAISGNLHGIVTDAQEGDKLPGANILVEGTSLGAATNVDGEYTIANIPVGQYTIRVSYIGYQSQTLEVNIQNGRTLEKNFELSPEVIEGEVVTVTAQARGQLAAINEQLTSTRIINVVSSEKMEELPDANAAESIGRLPGVSLQRNSGEADKIVVRGLSPKYNVVTIEGVKMASTNDFDRSVDLSIIQGDMLDGIEVSKTLKPDMDADALGGTINLRLKEAEEGWHSNVQMEGGYADINSSWDNYKFVGNVSNRFLNNKLGARFEVTAENKDLPSDRFGGNYSGALYVNRPDSIEALYGKEWDVRTEGAALTDQNMTRKRFGGSLIMDYTSKWWDIKFYNLVNRKKDSDDFRTTNFTFMPQFNPQRLSMNVGKDFWTTDSRTHSLQNLFKIGETRLNLDLSTTVSKAVRDGEYFNFVEVGDPGLNTNWLIYKQPADILKNYAMNYEETFLQQFNYTDQELNDKSYDVHLDYDVPVTITKNISGKFSVGGKYHYLKRDSDGSTEYSGFDWAEVLRRELLLSLYPSIKTDISAQRGIRAKNFVDWGYDPGNFLNGRYDLEWAPDVEMLSEMQRSYHENFSAAYFVNGVESYERDYENNENLSAGYMMMELNFGDNLMVLPGVRYERMQTEFSAYHIKTNDGRTGIEENPAYVTAKRDHDAWFPSVNFKYSLQQNTFFQGAVYKSTSRPDFRQISPMVIYNHTDSGMRSNNPFLKPSTVWNYDLGFSVFSNKLGLFSLYGYYKELSDLVFYMNDYKPYKKGLIVGGPAGLNEELLGSEYYDPRFVVASSNVYSIPINNFEMAYYRGIELSWQTNFWYLPGLLRGLVLDVNYTFIDSETQYPYFETVTIGWDSSGFIPKAITAQEYNTRKGAMIDQPRSILNLILGWDYKGFSSRVSYRYQDRTLQSLDTKLSVFDRYYDSFSLIDISLKQNINEHYALYVNMTNVGNHIDDYLIGAQGGNPSLPTSSEYYGFRSQFGISIKY